MPRHCALGSITQSERLGTRRCIIGRSVWQFRGRGTSNRHLLYRRLCCQTESLLYKMAAMSGYKPTSRRPIAVVFRQTAGFATRFCVRHGIHADAISYLSIVASLIAAICFWKSGARPWLLIIAPLFCYLRLWFNMLDGLVAFAAGKASSRGEILNDLPDRISDIVIFVGVAHSGFTNPLIGYWAAILAVLTSYVGLFGQALGVQRQFGGVMSKPWRMVALHCGAWLTFFLAPQSSATFTILDWTCLVVIAGCVETIVVRLKRITTALQDRR
jgi:phosphatidylglycerophosphate synthase